MDRITIRKVGGQWTSTHPGYGFGRPYSTTHPTWSAAIRSTAPRPGTSGAWLDRRSQFDYDTTQAAS